MHVFFHELDDDEVQEDDWINRDHEDDEYQLSQDDQTIHAEDALNSPFLEDLENSIHDLKHNLTLFIGVCKLDLK